MDVRFGENAFDGNARGKQAFDEDGHIEEQQKTMTKIYENHAQDSRVRDCGQVSPTIHRKTGTGGNNVPLVMKRLVCTMDMMGGKPGCHFSRENVSPTFTKGRASVNDIHLVCRVGK